MEEKVEQEKRKKKNIYTYPVKISWLQEITISAVRNDRHLIISEKEQHKINIKHYMCQS